MPYLGDAESDKAFVEEMLDVDEWRRKMLKVARARRDLGPGKNTRIRELALAVHLTFVGGQYLNDQARLRVQWCHRWIKMKVKGIPRYVSNRKENDK